MDIQIQYAAAKDAAPIAALSRQTFYDTFAASNTKEDMDKFMSESFSTEALMNEVTADGNIFLVAVMDGELVGYAKMLLSANPPELGNANAIEIGRIYAAQKTIGKGVGKALMQQCLQIAAEKGRELVWLGVWEHNQRAINFYTKFGFEKFGQHDFVLGNDVQTDWLMKKKVCAASPNGCS